MRILYLIESEKKHLISFLNFHHNLENSIVSNVRFRSSYVTGEMIVNVSKRWAAFFRFHNNFLLFEVKSNKLWRNFDLIES